MSKNQNRAVAYARINLVAQADGTSLDTQTAEMARLAKETGHLIGPGDVLREIASGASLDRLQLNKLRRMAAAGELDALFVYNLDRLSRDLVHLLTLMREFEAHGVVVHIVRGPSDPSPEGELVRLVLGFCEQQWCARIREHTIRGKDFAARSGRMPTGMRVQPDGYNLDPETKKRVVNEVEAEVVVRVFSLYAEGVHMHRIVNMLNAEGVRTKTGKAWSRVALHRMLCNTSYIGVDYYGKTRSVGGRRGNSKRVAAPREEWIEMSGYTPAIISKEMFEKVQERLGEAQARFRGDRAHPRFLVGSVRCGSCDASMAVRGGAGKHWYYRCSGASRSGAQQGAGSGECRARAVKADWLEDLVWSHVVAIVRDPSGVTADLELNRQERAGELGQEIERLRGEVQKEEQGEVRLLKLCREGTLRLELLVASMEESSTLLADLRVRLAELDEQREREENALAACERVREYCLMVSAKLEELDPACKRALMARLGVKVLVVEGEVTITAEIDLDLW